MWIVIFANVNGLFHCAAIQFDGVPSCPCLCILVKWQCWFPTAPSNPFISFVLFLQYSHPKSAQQSNQFGWFTTDHIYPSDLSWIVLHYVELYVYVYIYMEVLLGVVRENGQRCSKAITRNLFEFAIQHDFFSGYRNCERLIGVCVIWGGLSTWVLVPRIHSAPKVQLSGEVPSPQSTTDYLSQEVKWIVVSLHAVSTIGAISIGGVSMQFHSFPLIIYISQGPRDKKVGYCTSVKDKIRICKSSTTVLLLEKLVSGWEEHPNPSKSSVPEYDIDHIEFWGFHNLQSFALLSSVESRSPRSAYSGKQTSASWPFALQPTVAWSNETGT